MKETTALWLVCAILAAGLGISIVTAIGAGQKANEGQRTGWCYLESLVLKNKRSTPAKKHQTIVVIKHLLTKINEPDCTH